MRSTSVFFVVLILSSNAVLGACESPLFQNGKYQIQKSVAPNGDIEFAIALNNRDSAESVIRIVGNCQKTLRAVTVSDERVSLEVEHFPDGHVRQYVVKTCGREIGLIKIERETCRRAGKCLQPRIILTDPSDRIIAEIANAENTDKSILLRDNMSQIIARGHVLENGKWEIDSQVLSPLLNAMIFSVASMERKSCMEASMFEASVTGMAIVGTVVALVFGSVYWKMFR